MIKAIFFDAGSTLIDPKPNIEGVFYEAALLRGHSIDFEDVRQHMPEVNRLYEDEYARNGDFWCSPEASVEMYLDMYRYLARLSGLSHDAESIAQAVHQSYLTPKYWSIIDDVLPCLAELRNAQFRLAVVSNWAPNLEDLLHGLMLKPYFEEVISSASVGCRKPSPTIFKLTLERMDLAAHEVVHVGDHVQADGAGAAAAGITPVIVDRHQQHAACAFTRIRSFSELPAFVKNLSNEYRPCETERHRCSEF